MKEVGIKKRNELKYFSEKKFKFILCSCTKGHYFVISLEFDPKGTDGNVFKNVNIYDSMKITPRMQETKINNKSSYGVVLKKFQQFICKYVLWDNEVGQSISLNNEYILEKGKHWKCPQQNNTHDCSLFAFGIVLHLINNKRIDSNIFTQTNICYFCEALYTVLNASPSHTMPDPMRVNCR